MERTNEQLLQEIEVRKQAEEALRESEERVSSFMNSALDSMYLLDSALNFVEVNNRGLEIIGKKREEVVGKNITDIVPDVKESGRYEKHLEVIKTGKPFEIEDFVPHPIFGDLHFILKSFKVGDGLGVIASDITERKQAEEALRESEERYRTLVETIPHGIQEIDNSGIITFANAGHHWIFGYDEGELLGRSMLDFIAGDSARKELEDYVEILVNERPKPLEVAMAMVRLDGAGGGKVPPPVTLIVTVRSAVEPSVKTT